MIGYFNKEYIHAGVFAREYLTIINNASIIRNHSDYDDFYLCSTEETGALIEDAKRFIDAVELYLNRQESY